MFFTWQRAFIARFEKNYEVGRAETGQDGDPIVRDWYGELSGVWGWVGTRHGVEYPAGGAPPYLGVCLDQLSPWFHYENMPQSFAVNTPWMMPDS